MRTKELIVGRVDGWGVRILLAAIACFLIDCRCQAQPFTAGSIAFGGQWTTVSYQPPVPPTLAGGELPLLWTRGAVVTNGSAITMANLASTGVAYDLTNRVGAAQWPVAGPSLNGLPTLSFNVSGARDNLQSKNFTNAGTRMLVGMVVAITNKPDYYVFDSATNSSGGHAGLQPGQTDDATTQLQLCLRAQYSGRPAFMVTNRWHTLIAVFNGAASTVYTNGVAGATLDIGTTTANGFTLGANYINDGSGAPFAFAEMVVYTNLTAGSIANLHSYFTNRYALTP
jgi:hypothetical protein